MLADKYGWLPEQVSQLTMNQVRIYVSDQDMLAGKVKFKTASEMKAYQGRAKDRIGEIARLTAQRMQEGR